MVSIAIDPRDLIEVITDISSLWEADLDSFVDDNCSVFKEVGETYSHEQHGIWQKYCKIVEDKLETALRKFKFGMESLEEFLLQHMRDLDFSDSFSGFIDRYAS